MVTVLTGVYCPCADKKPACAYLCLLAALQAGWAARLSGKDLPGQTVCLSTTTEERKAAGIAHPTLPSEDG